MNFDMGLLFGGIILCAVVIIIAFILLRVLRQEIKLSQDQFLQTAQQQFAAEQIKMTSELEMRKQAVQSSVQALKEELSKYQKMLHDLEKDRDTKYGNLEAGLKNASQSTAQLQETTQNLNNILGNVRLRGQWGERTAEDIIRYAGLIEDVNYRKQKKLNSGTTKPDFTFLLPDDHKVNMDVKFPLDNYVKMVNAEDPMRKDMLQKEFFKNVKERVQEIQTRNYISPEENTLDFVLLFIPNEQVFGLIQEHRPQLMDEALNQKVVLCSPFTLYAMLSVIRQAYENFRYEKDIKKIILLIEQFANIYEKFKTRFLDVGKAIEKLDGQYRDILNKSFRQLDTKIRHIDDYKRGHKTVSENKDESSPILPHESQDDENLQ